MRLSRSDLELEVLYSRIRRGELDLQPDFQRGEVWDRARQTRLIDTILRRWYIPAVHIVREGDSQREYVLDGQQRLRTIYSFFDNEFRVAGRLPPLSNELVSLDGLRFAQLPPEYQRRFQRFELTVITLTDFEPDEPSELFFRLNQQYSLTPPEKRNALFGEARDQVKYIVSQLVDADALNRLKVGFSNGRLAYDDVIARFCLTLQNGTLRLHISNSYVEDFYRTQKFAEDVVSKAIDAGLLLGHALEILPRVRFNKATLYSWLIFVNSGSAADYRSLAEFIDKFESLRSSKDDSIFFSRPLQPLIDTYNDRASYRVLDVSSVLLRDLVLHVAHAELAQPVLREFDLVPLLNRNYYTADVESTLLDFIESTNWGADI